MFDLHLLLKNLFLVANVPLVLYNKDNFPEMYLPDTSIFRSMSRLIPPDLLKNTNKMTVESVAGSLTFAALKIAGEGTVVFGPFLSVPYERLDPQKISSLMHDKAYDIVQIANFFVAYSYTGYRRIAALLEMVNNAVNNDSSVFTDTEFIAADESLSFFSGDDSPFSGDEYYETKMFMLVKSGQVEALNLFREIITVKPGDDEFSGTYLRQCRNRIIACIVIARRAAVCGGLNYEMARNLSSSYMNEAERLFDVASLNRLASAMLRRFAELVCQCRAGGRPSALVTRVNNYIIRHINESITGDDIARHLNMNRTYLCQKFKTESGISLGEHIKVARMNEAKRLLSFGEYSILDVAVMLDYATQSSFHNAFRSYTGMTPGEWRKTHMIVANINSANALSFVPIIENGH